MFQVLNFRRRGKNDFRRILPMFWEQISSEKVLKMSEYFRIWVNRSLSLVKVLRIVNILSTMNIVRKGLDAV